MPASFSLWKLPPPLRKPPLAMSTSAHKLHFISPAEFLDGEEKSELRHEYIDGLVQAKSGASDRHNEIALDVASLVKTRLKGAFRVIITINRETMRLYRNFAKFLFYSKSSRQ